MKIRFMRKARITPGKRDEALQFAAMISDHFDDKFGTETTWGLEIGGDVGTVHWYSDHDSMSALESVIERASVDAETNKLIADAADLFLPGTQDKLVGIM